MAEHDLWVVPVAGGDEKRLTAGGHGLLLHGDLDSVRRRRDGPQASRMVGKPAMP